MLLRHLIERAAGPRLDGAQHHEHLVARLLRDDLLVAVGDLPALRKLDREAQRRMQEHVAADDAVFRIVAEDDAVDAREIAVAIDDPRALAAGAHFLHRLADARRAVLGLRMRRQPVRHAVAIGHLRNPRERRQERRHLVRIPSARRRVLRAQRVGLQLVVAAELEEQHAEAALREIAERAICGTKMLPTSTPSDAPMPRVYCCAEWRAVTWPISCPSTPTSCASLSRYGRMPRVM